MQTREQLIRAVARVLGMLPAGQTLAAEDYADLDEQIDPALAELSNGGVFDSDDTQNFNDAVVPALADCIAAICASQQEVSQLRGLTVEQFRILAEQRLRRVTAAKAVNSTVKAVYY